MRFNEIQLFEDRREDLEYKEKKVKGLVDRATVELKGTESARFTRMARMLKKLDNQISRLTALRENINKKLKGHAEDMFDAEDITITRVIETVNATLTLSKRQPPGKKTSVDYAKAWGELYELYPELKEQLDTLLEKYTKVSDTVAKEPALRVKDKEGDKKNESLHEGVSKRVIDKVRQIGDWLKGKTERWAQNFDQKLENVKSMIPGELEEAPVVSSWIDDLEYNEGDDTVTMTTDGGREYDIEDMDEDDYEDWYSAPSKGKHWHRSVRGIKT